MFFLSKLYALVIWIRNRLYDFKVLQSKKIENVEVICIGNIVTGGTGKTPAVQYFAKELILQGKKVGILSRGYKGKREKDPYLVRDYKNIYGTPIESGDEAFLHASELDIPVVVSKDRYLGGKYLKEKFDVDIIIMDDGFQHRKLIKDRSIILIDATNPFGDYQYLPKGKLRDSIRELKRADEIIITKSNYVSQIELNKIVSGLEKYNKPIKFASYYVDYFYNQKNVIVKNNIKGRNVFLFSSIANPNIFEKSIQDFNPNHIENKIFSDHHTYTDEELEELNIVAKKYDIAITTEKDIVKINKNIDNLLVAKMKFIIQDN